MKTPVRRAARMAWLLHASAIGRKSVINTEGNLSDGESARPLREHRRSVRLNAMGQQDQHRRVEIQLLNLRRIFDITAE